MDMSATRAVVFYLDGTLTDSAPGIGQILNSMRLERRLPPLPVDAFRRWVSLGVQHMVANALEIPGPAVAAAIAEFRQRYAVAPTTPQDLYPGVEEALNELASAGMPMGVCSNKPHVLCEKVLVGTGIRRFFKAVLGGDSVSQSKPHPMHLNLTLAKMGCAGEAFFFVGDSVIDADAADAAGAIFLWASYGYCDSDALADRGIKLEGPMDVVARILPHTLDAPHVASRF
jgi:phosphoglycolate phosphatase